jgi:hypothetical protein
MTDRDTFAAAALTGLLASRNDIDDEAAERAYCIADAMLRERSRSGHNDAETLPQHAKCTDRDRFAKPMQNEKSAEVLPRPYEICDEKRSFSDTNHDAAPAAKARTESASCGRGCGGTDKPVTLPAVGTGDIPCSRTRDICERLRRWCHAVDAESAQDLMDEAATEIEVQRACTSAARAEIERLRQFDRLQPIEPTDATPATHATPGEGSVQGKGTLADEERAAIMASQGFWALEDSPHADTLRSLLERLA